MFPKTQKINLSKIIGLLFLCWGLFLISFPALARENVYDWYIKEFDTKIIVNKDSSLDITERITADCGNATGKHGIFRVLPEEVKLTNGGSIKSPIRLISIKNFEGRPVEYKQSRNYNDKTVTWKIGDPDKTVQGVNNYEIHYRVENAIRFQPEFDELYWNLSGNFWDLEIDEFRAEIIFPEEVAKNNAEVDYYTGRLGSRYKNQASFQWTADNILEFNSIGTLYSGDGITASVTVPKNIFIPYQPSLWESYGKYFPFIIPLAIFIFCFRYWWKYGRDPKVDKAIVPEYSPPGSLFPAEMGIVDNGSYYDSLTTAEIINLATKGLLTIKETNNKILLFNIKDYVLTRKKNEEKEKELASYQKTILKRIFKEGDSVNLSDLRSTFPAVINQIEDEAMRCVQSKNLITRSGEHKMTVFVTTGIITLFIAGVMFFAWIGNNFSIPGSIWASFLSAGIILIFWGILMKKRTPEGAELAWQIKGFKLFMETVDKDRAKFYERENIFEKFLPYAIAFEMTDEWIKKMKEIYGEEYFAAHTPSWYIGSSVAAFDADNFASTINSLSKSISQNTSSSSGSGGGGSSGGGGGGGGGGGW